MNRSHLWKFLLVLFVLGWSIFEITPPKGRDVLQEFERNADRKDATFSNIVARAKALQQEMPERTFGNFKEAIGTNDITKYFPRIDAKGEKNPSVSSSTASSAILSAKSNWASTCKAALPSWWAWIPTNCPPSRNRGSGHRAGRGSAPQARG